MRHVAQVEPIILYNILYYIICVCIIIIIIIIIISRAVELPFVCRGYFARQESISAQCELPRVYSWSEFVTFK